MDVQFSRRAMLVLLAINLLIAFQVSPVLARDPRYSDTVRDAREGDPGDGVLSPSATSFDADISPTYATALVDDMEFATTSAPSVNLTATPPGMFFIFSPVYGPVPVATTSQGWSTIVQGIFSRWPSRTTGGWTHVW